MTVKVLIDAMLPWRLANLFRDYGHQARHVRRLKDLGSSDRLIWQTAIANGEIVISSDKDFKTIQNSSQTAKLIFYNKNNYNRARILADFADQMKNIEAFAESSEILLEIV